MIKIFQMDESTWYAGPTVEAVCAQYETDCGEAPDSIPHPLTTGLDSLTFHDEEGLGVDRDPTKWRCTACGQLATSSDRWNGEAYEHSHPYPAGHMLCVPTHKRSFRAELAIRVKEDPELCGFFASTEY